MTNYSILSSNLKRGLIQFSERISSRLSRPNFKFISQMVYGILSSQSCHLSKIARSLDEDILLKKTIERLSRNLATFNQFDNLLTNYVKKIKGCFNNRTILIIDDGDITKPCSPKMEHIYAVRDGSKGTTGMGYWMTSVTALSPEQKAPIGVYTRIYSASEPNFVSAEEETMQAIRFVSKNFKKSNIRAFDRGYDANKYFEYLIDRKERFVIRATTKRHVIYKGETVKIDTLAQRFKGKYKMEFHKRNGQVADCKISIVPIRLCCRPDEDLNLVICRNIGQNPMLLITNLKSEDKRLAVAVTKVYLLRWRIEEFYGFKKQQFEFEDFRVRSLNSIRNLDLILTIAIGYIGLISEKADDKRISMELIHISKRIYGIPKFKFYAIADGIFEIFARCKKGITLMLRKQLWDGQFSFLPGSVFGIP
jgi:hypothetical protein